MELFPGVSERLWFVQSDEVFVQGLRIDLFREGRGSFDLDGDWINYVILTISTSASLQQIEQLTVPNKECRDDELLVGEGTWSYAGRDMKGRMILRPGEAS